MNSLTIDNRDQAQMNDFLESRIDALRRALADSQREVSRFCSEVIALTEQNERLKKRVDTLEQELLDTDAAFIRAMED